MPSALVLVLDNSPSAGQVVNGTSRLTDLRAAARRILDGATPADGLWLLTADGIPQRGTAAELSRVVDSLAASDRRMDLGEAVASATQVLGADARPGGIAVLSDLQATALSPARVNTPLLVVRMEGERPPNIGVASLSAGSQPWTVEGASVVVTLAGDSGRSAPVTVSLGGRTGRAALALVGTPSSLAVPGGASGWWTLRAFVDPDEFRADDERLAAVRVAPIAAVSWPAGDQYLQAAEAVLEANGRARKGPGGDDRFSWTLCVDRVATGGSGPTRGGQSSIGAAWRRMGLRRNRTSAGCGGQRTSARATNGFSSDTGCEQRRTPPARECWPRWAASRGLFGVLMWW